MIQIELETVEQEAADSVLQKFSDLRISAKTICSSSILHSVSFWVASISDSTKERGGQGAGVFMNCMAYERLT